MLRAILGQDAAERPAESEHESGVTKLQIAAGDVQIRNAGVDNLA